MDIISIELLTNNLEKTTAFYQELLDFEVVTKNQHEVTFRIGTSLIRFTENLSFNTIYHFAFNIPQNQVESALSWLQSKVEVILDTNEQSITKFEDWNAQAVYFYDNNGNILEFIARKDLNDHSSESFSSNLIRCVSEIGLVSDEPLALAEELIQEHGLNYFEKGPILSDFTALGDHNGLLILSRKGRNWYPTQHPAQKNSVSIKFTVENQIHTLDF